MRYDTEDEAVAIANGTAYGLTCALITQDHFRASRIADRLEAGMIFVNNPGDWGHIYWPFDHAEWNGWTPTEISAAGNTIGKMFKCR